MDRLKEVGIVHGDAQAIAFMGNQPDEPAFLVVRQGTDEYDLAPSYAKARELLVEGGRRELCGRERGRLSAARKSKHKRQ